MLPLTGRGVLSVQLAGSVQGPSQGSITSHWQCPCTEHVTPAPVAWPSIVHELWSTTLPLVTPHCAVPLSGNEPDTTQSAARVHWHGSGVLHVVPGATGCWLSVRLQLSMFTAPFSTLQLAEKEDTPPSELQVNVCVHVVHVLGVSVTAQPTPWGTVCCDAPS
jgi:hypothetical protein